MDELPRALFWDVASGQLDVRKHSRFISPGSTPSFPDPSPVEVSITIIGTVVEPAWQPKKCADT